MIGVAGCGRMGLPMAHALNAAGFPIRGFDIRPVEAPFICADIGEFCDGLTTLISVVRDAAQTENLLFSDQAVIAQAPRLSRILICSTLSPRDLHGIRSRVPERIGMIDAPMSGAAIAAQEKRLTFMVGAETGELSEIRPMLEAMGREIHHLGAFGSGMAAKVLNNLVAASSTAATRTALAWAAEMGMDRDVLLRLMHTSSGQTWFGSHFDSIEFARDGHAADNTIGILCKDVGAAMDAAPQGADLTLPEALIAALECLRPLED